MRHRAHLLCLALAAATSLTTCTVSLGEDNEDSKNRWSQWRGPSRTGIIEAEAWPNTLNESSLQVAWRVELGPSYSGPIVTDKHVFVTETVDEKFEVVRALKRDTGEEVWKVQWEGSMKVPFFANANGSWIRSTPCYDDGKLYVGGIRDVLVCLDAATGNEIWRVDFVKEHGGKVPDFGFVCSPMIDGDDLYIQAGGGLAKLNKNTGKLIWMGLKDGGGMMGSAFSSPIKTEINGMDQLVVQTRQKLCGVDPSDGSVLWSQEVPAFRGMNIVTPTVSGNKVFTSSYGGKSFLYEVKKSGDNWEVAETWNNRKQGYMSSPVLINNHVYLHLRNQRFTCINLESGEDTWTTDSFGKYWSLIANGDKILALDEQGELLLIQADPAEFKLLDSRKIAEEETWAHIAVVGDEVFVRELNAMTVFRWKQAP